MFVRHALYFSSPVMLHMLLQVRGKIVVFNYEWVNYGVSGRYRIFGAQRAAAVGAVATLIRSATPFSINSPHTGWQVIDTKKLKYSTIKVTFKT